MRALMLLPLIAVGCGTPYCGDQLRVGPDASPFEPYCSGDVLQVTGSEGSYALPLGFEVEGIDGSGGVTAVIRLTPEGGSSQDALGGLPLSESGGVWTTNTSFALQEQTAAELEALDGATAELSVAFTADITVEVVLTDMEIAAP
ncbi:MAG: hypothetical protein EP330_22080 [Deltaproteobacteria bacterium]|nr:MAG: hypothetical protein EP330_22080 [Deltaproteobacteria bacterium]